MNSIATIYKKMIFSSLILTLLTLPLAAGGGQAQNTAPAAGGSTGTGTGKIEYPVKTDVTLTHWLDLGQNISANYANLGDTPFGKAHAEKSGFKVTYLHPATGQGLEQFNLIIASGDMPDIMDHSWLRYPGGPEKAISDGIIHKLNDVFDKWGPNMKEYLVGHPEYDRQVKTDNSSYYAFYYIRGNNGLLVTNGPQMRKDWLDELGLAVPETFDDWHNVLVAFRDKKGATAPFSWVYADRLPFFQYYGLWPRGFALDDGGKVFYCPTNDGYREVLTLMNQWYKEGLLDPDFASMTAAQLNQKIANGVAGASSHQLGQGMGAWTLAARQANPKFEMIGVPYPVKNRGERAKLIHSSFPYTGDGAAITGKTKNLELAARYLDFNYTEAGHNLNNFGVEGVTYNWVDGYPKYTDFVFNNPQGWPIAQALSAYALATHSGPFIQDMRYLEQYYNLPEQLAAVRRWAFPEMHKYMVPPVTPTPEESREYASIMQEINTYQVEMEVKFVLGTEPLSGWDTYVANIKKLGIDRALEIQAAAIERYNRR